jgi:polyphosphate kinase 2 (PPK2 family)
VRLEVLQRRLYAEARRSLLVVIQGIDGSGKDGLIRRVFSGLNPQSCRVASFKVPTATELARKFPRGTGRRGTSFRRIETG